MANIDREWEDKAKAFFDKVDPFAIVDRFLERQAKNAKSPVGELAWMGVQLIVKTIWIIVLISFVYRIFVGWGK